MSKQPKLTENALKELMRRDLGFSEYVNERTDWQDALVDRLIELGWKRPL